MNFKKAAIEHKQWRHTTAECPVDSVGLSRIELRFIQFDEQ